MRSRSVRYTVDRRRSIRLSGELLVLAGSVFLVADVLIGGVEIAGYLGPSLVLEAKPDKPMIGGSALYVCSRQFEQDRR